MGWRSITEAEIGHFPEKNSYVSPSRINSSPPNQDGGDTADVHFIDLFSKYNIKIEHNFYGILFWGTLMMTVHNWCR